MAGWKFSIFNRRYIFNPGPFSIAMSVDPGVYPPFSQNVSHILPALEIPATNAQKKGSIYTYTSLKKNSLDTYIKTQGLYQKNKKQKKGPFSRLQIWRTSSGWFFHWKNQHKKKSNQSVDSWALLTNSVQPSPKHLERVVPPCPLKIRKVGRCISLLKTEIVPF